MGLGAKARAVPCRGRLLPEDALPSPASGLVDSLLLPLQSLPAVVENETVLGPDLVDVRLGALDNVRPPALVFPVPDDDPIPDGKVRHERLPWLALLVAHRVTRVRHET